MDTKVAFRVIMNRIGSLRIESYGDKRLDRLKNLSTLQGNSRLRYFERICKKPIKRVFLVRSEIWEHSMTKCVKLPVIY